MRGGRLVVDIVSCGKLEKAVAVFVNAKRIGARTREHLALASPVKTLLKQSSFQRPSARPSKLDAPTSKILTNMSQIAGLMTAIEHQKGVHAAALREKDDAIADLTGQLDREKLQHSKDNAAAKKVEALLAEQLVQMKKDHAAELAAQAEAAVADKQAALDALKEEHKAELAAQAEEAAAHEAEALTRQAAAHELEVAHRAVTRDQLTSTIDEQQRRHEAELTRVRETIARERARAWRMRRRPPARACELELTAGLAQMRNTHAAEMALAKRTSDELMEQLMAMKGKHEAEMQALRLSGAA